MGNICLSRSPGQKYVKGNGQEMRSSPRRRRKAAEIEAPAPASLKAAANDDETKKSDDEDEDEDEDEASSVESAPTSPPRDLRLNLQHISEREDLSNHPGTIFLERFREDTVAVEEGMKRKKRREQEHARQSPDGKPLGKSRKFSSCSTIYLDDNTVSQPNLKTTLKLVSLAIYYHCKNFPERPRILEIFDEKAHPLSRDPVGSGYDRHYPEHREIYRFVKILFNAAQLTSECAIITLVYLERLLTYADIDMHPSNWKRIVLGAIMLASKVWDDQAVWNVDYCQILKDISVEDMNELERVFLEMLQYNINVDSSVYARYYFDLRTLADANGFAFPVEPLSTERAKKLEALSILTSNDVTVKRVASLDQLVSPERPRVKSAILS